MTIVKAADLKLAIEKINKAIFIDKGIIVSNYIFIEAKENEGRIHITNIDNHFEAFFPLQGDDFRAIVSADLFIKYVNKLNDVKEIAFDLLDEGLQIKQGNSKAVFAMGDIAEDDFSLFEKIKLDGEVNKISYEDLKKVLDYLPSAVDENFYNPEYTCFLISENQALSTNAYKLCGLNISLFGLSTPYLLTFKLVKYMQGITNAGDLFFGVDEQGLHFYNDKIHILGLPYESDRIERMVSACNILLTKNYTGSIVIDKALLNEALDRLSLFINMEVKTILKMETKENNLILTNIKDTGREVIPVSNETGDILETSWYVDVSYFKTLFNVLVGDRITIKYDKDESTISLSDGVCNQVLALTTLE